MAESRQCGYCRAQGHRKPVCPLLHEQRNVILTHTPIQRKRLLEYLAKLGLGNGALVQFNNDWYNEREGRIGIIYDFDWVANCNFVDIRNVKYSKQVIIETRTVENDYFYRTLHVGYLSTGNGYSQPRNLGIRISRNIKALNGGDPKEWDWDKPHWDLSVPSHDVDYDPEVLVKNISMPRRLLLNGELEFGHRGIMP